MPETTQPGPTIFPLDCLVLGNCNSALPKDARRRVLHFWGRPRDDDLLPLDNTQLCFTAYYDQNKDPVYNRHRLQYLGLRNEKVEDIMVYFRLHFVLRGLMTSEISFTGSRGEHRKVLERWPGSDWYFLFPKGDEEETKAVERKIIWNSWARLRRPGPPTKSIQEKGII